MKAKNNEELLLLIQKFLSDDYEVHKIYSSKCRLDTGHSASSLISDYIHDKEPSELFHFWNYGIDWYNKNFLFSKIKEHLMEEVSLTEKEIEEFMEECELDIVDIICEKLDNSCLNYFMECLEDTNLSLMYYVWDLTSVDNKILLNKRIRMRDWSVRKFDNIEDLIKEYWKDGYRALQYAVLLWFDIEALISNKELQNYLEEITCENRYTPWGAWFFCFSMSWYELMKLKKEVKNWDLVTFVKCDFGEFDPRTETWYIGLNQGILNWNVVKFNWWHLMLDEAIANKGKIKVVKPAEKEEEIEFYHLVDTLP